MQETHNEPYRNAILPQGGAVITLLEVVTLLVKKRVAGIRVLFPASPQVLAAPSDKAILEAELGPCPSPSPIPLPLGHLRSAKKPLSFVLPLGRYSM